jgi:hypothetical protein
MMRAQKRAVGAVKPLNISFQIFHLPSFSSQPCGIILLGTSTGHIRIGRVFLRRYRYVYLRRYR